MKDLRDCGRLYPHCQIVIASLSMSVSAVRSLSLEGSGNVRSQKESSKSQPSPQISTLSANKSGCKSHVGERGAQNTTFFRTKGGRKVDLGV